MVMVSESKNIISRLSSDKIVKSLLEQMADSMSQSYKDSGDLLNVTTAAEHCIETATFIAEIAESLDIEPKVLEALVLGALIHDTGKSNIPLYILHSPYKLDDNEMKMIINHPVVGAVRINKQSKDDICTNDVCFEPWQWDIAVVLAAIHHRYKKNGKLKYPDVNEISRLCDMNVIKAEALQLVEENGFGELLAVCDVFSAICSNRPYADNRLSDENFVNPSTLTDAIDRADTIRSIVDYELDLSPIGSNELDLLTKNYATK